MATQPEAVTSTTVAEPPSSGSLAAPIQPQKTSSSLTLLQANLLVAMLGGFWARKADGHPGPDLMSRGLMILQLLVTWERTKKERPPGKRPLREGRRKPG